MARIVFMGTPDFAAECLRALIAAGHRPVGVVTQPDRPAGRRQQLRPPPVKQLAEAHGLPVVQPRKVREGRLARLLADWAPDIAIVVAYGRILPPDALALPPRGCVNVHASLLPRWRGAAPIHRAILAGDEETGVCLMRMEEGLDTGPVYAERSCPITPEDTAESLHDRLAVLAGALLCEHLPALLEGGIAPQAQNEALATLAPPLRKEEGEIRWSAPSRSIRDRVRGLHPWPGSYTWLGSRRLKLFPPLSPVAAEPAPGVIVAVAPEGLVVGCGDGALRLTEIQEQDRKRLPVAAWLAGRTIPPGTRLGGAPEPSA